MLVFLLGCGVLFIFFQSLNWLTNHGQETKVPMLTGKHLEKAMALLEKQGFTVEVDSTYQPGKEPLEILFQEPESGALVKVGRTIFLTVNRQSVPTVPMPNLKNLSFRNALLTMNSYRLEMGDTLYRPDVAAGAILEQWYQGRQVMPGEYVPLGAKITLVIGEGLSDMLDVPNLIGISWGDAKAQLESMALNYNVIWEGLITDTAKAIVYKQEPEAMNELDFVNQILAGDLMDVYVMQNPSPDLIKSNQPGSAKFLEPEDSSRNVGLPQAGVKPTRTGVQVGIPSAPVTNKPDLKKAQTISDASGVKINVNKPVKPLPSPKKNESSNAPVKKNDDPIGNDFE
ncbi:MAG: PASTA domain-containing protein [Chitinophagaceae bacterium]